MGHRSGRALLCLLGIVPVLAQHACSTTYQPSRTGRIAVVIHHGAASYLQDGREVPMAPFGGGLENLVQAAPAAGAHAKLARARFIVGIPAYLSGAAGVVVGITVISGPAGWVVVGLGALCVGAGLGFIGSGFTHALDAVNIHNDAVSPLHSTSGP